MHERFDKVPAWSTADETSSSVHRYQVLVQSGAVGQCCLVCFFVCGDIALCGLLPCLLSVCLSTCFLGLFVCLSGGLAVLSACFVADLEGHVRSVD